MLVIVNYQDIHRFLEMIRIKSFQFISILRVSVVRDFIFGFTKNWQEFLFLMGVKLVLKVIFIWYTILKPIQ